MAWIDLPPVAAATGMVRAEYDAAIARAGRVWQIVKIASLNGPVMKASMALYGAVMKGASPLTRAQREMIAVVVSQANECHY
jgi:alkylhydroperoxidase family enzyme